MSEIRAPYAAGRDVRAIIHDDIARALVLVETLCGAETANLLRAHIRVLSDHIRMLESQAQVLQLEHVDDDDLARWAS